MFEHTKLPPSQFRLALVPTNESLNPVTSSVLEFIAKFTNKIYKFTYISLNTTTKRKHKP